jgi:hypothetical protein
MKPGKAPNVGSATATPIRKSCSPEGRRTRTWTGAAEPAPSAGQGNGSAMT